MFLFCKAASRNDIAVVVVVDLASPEGQIIIIYEECGATMGSGVIQRDGIMRFVRTRSLTFYLYARIINSNIHTFSAKYNKLFFHTFPTTAVDVLIGKDSNEAALWLLLPK